MRPGRWAKAGLVYFIIACYIAIEISAALWKGLKGIFRRN